MNVNEISFIMPSHNTLNYTMMAYHSIRKYYPANEIIILDDGSDDGSWEWTEEQAKLDDNLRVWHNESKAIVGHTTTYGIGIRMCRGPLFSIFHSDMILGRGYLENMLKHWKPKTVICATRVEPEGIYPPGKEKELRPFGSYYYDFKQEEFDKFVEKELISSKDRVTYGSFAPWCMKKEEFIQVFGDHDITSFAPFSEEDADIFLRFTLAGYKLIQSRDSLVWHFISRSHRNWAQNGIGKDGPMFQFYQNRARRNYIRKWRKWMQFDEWHHPISHKVFRVGFVVTNVTTIDFLHAIEPWASHVYVDNMKIAKEYLAKEQLTTNVDLTPRIIDSKDDDVTKLIPSFVPDDVLLTFSENDFKANINGNMRVIINLTDILSNDIDNNSDFEYGIFKMKTGTLNDISKTLIKI